MLRRALVSGCLLLAAPALLPAAPAADLVPVLHSVSYAGSGAARPGWRWTRSSWRRGGSASPTWSVGKRPHLSPLDYDAAARAKLKARLAELGLTLACLAAYPDFTAGVEKPGIPAAGIGAIYVAEAAYILFLL